MSHLTSCSTSCRFCSHEGLDNNATWCPGCGLNDPINPANTAGLPISSVDSVQTPDGGQHKFFVCQNTACNFPVMPHEEKIKQQRDLMRRVIDNFKTRRQAFSWIADGWGFVLTGHPAQSLQTEAIAQWRTTFCCPNCRRPIFYRKAYAEMLPDERFEVSFRRVWRTALRIVLLVMFGWAILLTLGVIAVLKDSLLIGLAIAALNIDIIICLLGVSGLLGFILSYNVAFDNAEGL